VWRAPERLAPSPAWTGASALIDVPVFGETGLIASRRAADGKPSQLRDATRSATGTLVLSGAMVPGREADTLYPCRIDRDTKLLTVDGPPAGMVSVGGYRFALRTLQDLVEAAGDGTLAALPDVLTGHRLAGTAADRNAICDALAAQGANPLLIAAFRARRTDDRASAA
jgi:hypothetical protein